MSRVAAARDEWAEIIAGPDHADVFEALVDVVLRPSDCPMVGFDHRQAETMASVWLETKPSGLAMQRQVFDRATAVGLGPEWQRRPGRWGGLQAMTPVLELGDHRAVVRWFVERVIELRETGLLALAVGAPASAAQEPADSADPDE